jgi:hypothetical protein
MDPASILGVLGTVFTIAQSFGELAAKFYRMRKQFPLAMPQIDALKNDISDYHVLWLLTHTTLEGRDFKGQSIEFSSLEKILRNAKKIKKSITRFVRAQSKLLKTYDPTSSWWFRQYRETVLAWKWGAAQSELSLLKWRLRSSKTSLDLLITLLTLHDLGKLLQQERSKKTVDMNVVEQRKQMM